jgi:hypothetical protein
MGPLNGVEWIAKDELALTSGQNERSRATEGEEEEDEDEDE